MRINILYRLSSENNLLSCFSLNSPQVRQRTFPLSLQREGKSIADAKGVSQNKGDK